jgi:DNA modification methylase
MGSGTTAKACILLSRNFIGCDISPEYCDIANERLRLTRAEIQRKEIEPNLFLNNNF